MNLVSEGPNRDQYGDRLDYMTVFNGLQVHHMSLMVDYDLENTHTLASPCTFSYYANFAIDSLTCSKSLRNS